MYYTYKYQVLDVVHYLTQKEHNILGTEPISVLQWQLLSWARQNYSPAFPPFHLRKEMVPGPKIVSYFLSTI